MMFQKIKLLFAVLLLAGLATQLALAESFSQDDLAFAFGASSLNNGLGEIALLSDQEMADTEGNLAPLIAIGVLHGGRFIVTRYVSRRIAVSALQRGCNVYCSRSSTARSLARQAFGRNNVIRHGPSGHVRSPVHYSHYQRARGGNFSNHVFYGRRW